VGKPAFHLFKGQADMYQCGIRHSLRLLSVRPLSRERKIAGRLEKKTIDTQ